MLKIHDMTTKQTLEIQDTDLLIIEDEEDTKAMTVATLKELVAGTTDTQTKKSINHVLDQIATAIIGAKYIIATTKQYITYAWIDTTLGDIKIAMKPVETNKWLTKEDIEEVLLMSSEDMTNDFVIKTMVNDYVETAVSYELCRFSDDYTSNAFTEVEQELFDVDAGYIKARFAGLTENDISGITYNDISITLQGNEAVTFDIQMNEELFVNNVPYEGVV